MREWKHIVCSKVILWGVFAISLLSAVVFISMMSSGLPTKIAIAIVDHDNSSVSRSLARQLDAFPKTEIAYHCESFTEARQLMEKGDVYAILTIPEGFAKNASTGQQPKLCYYTNNAYLVNGSLLFQDLKVVSTLASASVVLKVNTAKGKPSEQSMQMAQPISVDSYPLNNPSLNYSIYLNNMILPGILQLIILMFTVYSLGYEIKSGTGEELFSSSGGSTLKTLLGKFLPYTVMYSVIALMFMSILYKFNGFPLKGGFLPMFLNYLLLIIASQGLAIIIFAVFRNYRFSLSVACLLGVLSIPLSGFSFPATGMYGALQAWGYLLPLRHFFLSYVDQALNGIPLGYSTYHYAALLVFVFISMLLLGRVRNILEKDAYAM